MSDVLDAKRIMDRQYTMVELRKLGLISMSELLKQYGMDRKSLADGRRVATVARRRARRAQRNANQRAKHDAAKS